MKDPAELAYEASLMAFELHERMLESLRARTGSVIAAASISASFLGSTAFRQENPGCLALLLSYGGAVAFVGSLVAAVIVLWPRTNRWLLEPSPALILQAFLDRPHQEQNETLAQLARANEGQSDEMKRRMDPLWKQFRWSVILLGVQVVLWLSALAVEVG